MEAIEAILTRRSVRAYTDEPVSKTDIDTIIRAGLASPSARNDQPVRLVIITDRFLLDALSKANPNAGMLAGAPLGIMVCGQQKRSDRFGQIKDNEYWQQDCAASTQNILLASHALGLGAVWTGTFPNPKRVAVARQMVGLPLDVEPLCIIAIGHPSEEGNLKQTYREDKIHYNKW